MSQLLVSRLRPGDEKIVEMCVAIAAHKYPPFDIKAATAWGYAALNREDVAIFVTKNCFAVAVTYELFWAPAKAYASLILLCSGRDDKRSGGQLMALARSFNEWAIKRGCVRLDFDAETTGVDLGPLARRIGPTRPHSHYMVDLAAKGS